MQWSCGEADEDHAVAVLYNLMLAELVRYEMRMLHDRAVDLVLSVKPTTRVWD